MPLAPRAIVQCSKDGEDIRVFPSALEACEAVGTKHKVHIYKSIKYGVVAFGYRWRWIDEPLKDAQGYNMRLKPVIASKDGIETEYDNIVIASKDIGATISHIQEAILTGGTAKGYQIRLKGEEQKPKAKRSSRYKEVIAIDDDGNIVKQWASVYDASKELGVIDAAIYWCVSPKHPNAKCKGYRLRYKEGYLQK